MSQKRAKYAVANKYKYQESESSEDNYDENSSIEQVSKVKTKKKSRKRQENSLGELTKNFIEYIKRQGGKEININKVVKELKVKKRRIYDITNVLEGKPYYIITISLSFFFKFFKPNTQSP
jgi:hypothetical protein